MDVANSLVRRVGCATSLAPTLTCSSPQPWVSTDERHDHEQVLAIELSQVDNGADIFEFSQYPGKSGH
jgi:hypothetical protein